MSVLTITQRQGNSLHKISWEALAVGQQIAEKLNEELAAVIIGHSGLDVDSAVGELAQRGVENIYIANHDLLQSYTSDGFSIALGRVVEKVKPRLVIFPHTYQVRDFGPRIATSFKRRFVDDIVGLGLNNNNLNFVRRIFQGKFNAGVSLDEEPPHFISVQSGVFQFTPKEPVQNPTVTMVEIALDPSQIRTVPEESFREAGDGEDITASKIIVAVGRGINGQENIPMVKELAGLIGGRVGASRPVCDNKWMPQNSQIGSSGLTVAPDLYLGLGISGAIQHVIGMKGSKVIVAVNKDRSAPIFDIAHIGIIADLHEFVPVLIKVVREREGKG